jgi:hypothetical protein
MNQKTTRFKDDFVMQELLSCNGDIECINHKLKSLKVKDCDFTLEEIGRIMHITRERVRQIENSAIKKLKHPSIGRVVLEYLRL